MGTACLWWRPPPDPAPAALPEAPYDYYGTNVLQARAVALSWADRPKQFIIADMIRGPGTSDYGQAQDPLILACAIETVALIGSNTLEMILFGDAQATAVAQAQAWGIRRFLRAVAATPEAWSWEPEATAPNAATWAGDLATHAEETLGFPLGDVVLAPISDEPGWYYPSLLADSGGLPDVPAALTQFRAYLEAKGFEPEDFGETEWTAVQPCLVTAAVTLADARRYVWTMRFLSDTYAEALALYTDALRSAFHPGLITLANFNNFLSRWYIPSPGRLIFNNPDDSDDAAYGSGDWHQIGRTASVGALWTEDWTPNVNAQIWSLTGDLMKSGAARGGITFGGYVVGLTLGQGLLTYGGRYKALALLGRGAKALLWYNHGPEEIFPDNGWSNNVYAYGQIADANRLIARAEDLLYPGQPRATRIALLLPVWACVWDLHPPLAGDPEVWGVFHEELLGLHYAFMHAGYMVDFLSEDDVVAHLADYDLVYVTAPNVAQAVQTALASWIAAGGVAWFAPGAAASDEYNQPCTILDATRGLTAQVLARKYRNEDVNETPFTVTMLDVTVGGVLLAAPAVDAYVRQTERLDVTTATPIATFDDDDTPAVVYQATGSGYALSSGIWIAAAYYGSADRSHADFLPTTWSARLRGLLTAPAQIAGITKAVTVDHAMVEAQRLDSEGGSAITLLNWDDRTPIAALAVTVPDCPPIARAVLSDTRATIAFSQVGGTVSVTVPLATVDVLKLYAA